MVRKTVRCSCCRGETPLFVKQHSEYPYKLSMWLDGNLLHTEAQLGSVIGLRKVLSNVHISTKAYYCPLCGYQLDEKPRLGTGNACSYCVDDQTGSEKTRLVDILQPGLLTAKYSGGEIIVLANLGFERQNRIGFISNADHIPVSHCMICGRNVSSKKRLSLSGFEGGPC